MLCSIPTSRSSSNWLDRLHSKSNPNPTPNSPKKIFLQKKQHIFDLMNNVLSELFVMGDPPDSSAPLKSSRKQPNPRACVPSSSASAANCEASDNSIAEAKKKDGRKMKRQMDGCDPSVYSGTVVTVIDTSSPGWKSEKRFSKRREKWNVSRKKRRLGEKEKAERLRPLAELKEREKKDYEACAANINGKSVKESEYHIQIPRRLKFLRSPRLPVKKSSLFRLQVITKTPKSGLSTIRGTFKSKPLSN